LIAFLLLLVFSYIFSISKTISLGEEISRLEKEEKDATFSAEKIANYSQELLLLNKKIKAYAVDTSSNNDNLLSLITDFCHANQLVLQSFPLPSSYNNNNLIVLSREIHVKGSFHNLLRLLYELEFQQSVGRIGSVVFHTKIDRKTNRKILYLNFVIQNCQLN